jgi:V/A-type H+-transporting ATPase subunit E
MAQDGMISHGVDALIDKLRSDGVAAGQADAEKLRADAKAEAAKILADAKRESDAYQKKARSDSDSYRAAGEEALNTAMRDAVLTMKAGLTDRFREDVERLVTKEMADPNLLKQMILEVVGRAAEGANLKGKVQVILPAKVATQEDIKQNADDIQSGKLTKYVLGLTAEMLREQVELHAADDAQDGIRVRAEDQGVVLDLTDKAVASLLMQHLQPRFRAVLEGVIR